MIRPRFASAVLPVLYQAQNQGQLNPGRNFQVPSKSFGVYELLATRQHISFAIAQLHISDSNDFPRHHQLKTPHLGADRLAYLSSLGAAPLGLHQPQVVWRTCSSHLNEG